MFSAFDGIKNYEELFDSFIHFMIIYNDKSLDTIKLTNVIMFLAKPN